RPHLQTPEPLPIGSWIRISGRDGRALVRGIAHIGGRTQSVLVPKSIGNPVGVPASAGKLQC
ncbi:MAG: hypothetical protein RRC34_15595, partial [Lentisphaeria bacterium]|nr:hypothetical protein [Lentisphaeria bacterium]